MRNQEKTFKCCWWTLIAAAGIAAVLLLGSCTTTRYVPVVETHEQHHWHTDSVKQMDSVYHEKTTTIMQLDSAAMAKYGIQLKAAERAWLVKTAELERQLQQLERLTAERDSVHDSIPVPVPYPVTVEVPAQLSWWQRFRMNAGGIALGLLAICVGYGIFRFIKRL